LYDLKNERKIIALIETSKNSIKEQLQEEKKKIGLEDQLLDSESTISLIESRSNYARLYKKKSEQYLKRSVR